MGLEVLNVEGGRRSMQEDAEEVCGEAGETCVGTAPAEKTEEV